MNTSEKIQLESKRTGHNRLACSLEKKARHAGKGSQEWARYIHHVSEYVRISEILENA